MPYQIRHLDSVSQSRAELYNLGPGLALLLDETVPERKQRSDAPADRRRMRLPRGR